MAKINFAIPGNEIAEEEVTKVMNRLYEINSPDKKQAYLHDFWNQHKNCFNVCYFMLAFVSHIRDYRKQYREDQIYLHDLFQGRISKDELKVYRQFLENAIFLQTLQENFPFAEECTLEYRSLFPRDQANITLFLAMLYARENKEESLNALIEQYPDYTYLPFVYGLFLIFNKRYNEANSLIARQNKINPQLCEYLQYGLDSTNTLSNGPVPFDFWSKPKDQIKQRDLFMYFMTIVFEVKEQIVPFFLYNGKRIIAKYNITPLQIDYLERLLETADPEIPLYQFGHDADVREFLQKGILHRGKNCYYLDDQVINAACYLKDITHRH